MVFQRCLPHPRRVFISRVCEYAVLNGVFICQGGHNKAPQTRWLIKQKSISSQFWGLKVQDQDARSFLRPLSLAYGWPPHTAFSRCLSSHTHASPMLHSMAKFPAFDTRQIILGPTQMTSLNTLSHFSKDPVSRYSHILTP